MGKEKRRTVVDFFVVLFVIGLTFFLFISKRSSELISRSAIMSPEEAHQDLMKRIKNTPIDPTYSPKGVLGMINDFSFRLLDQSSQYKVSNVFIHWWNKKQGSLLECFLCTIECDKEEKKKWERDEIDYPVDLTWQELKKKQREETSLMMIDVRRKDLFITSHLPSSVNIPLNQLVDQMFTMDRWTEIVLVGENYWQTKLTGETLLKLNFHRIHRLMDPIHVALKKQGAYR